MNTAARMLLLLGSRATAVTYLFRDEFTTAAGAPLASPRTCEPGPGSWTVTDSANHQSIASGALHADGGASAYGNPGLLATAALARVAGRALITSLLLSTSVQNFGVGWSDGTSLVWNVDLNLAGLNTGGGTIKIHPYGDLLSVSAEPNFALATQYGLAVVLRSNGEFFFVKVGAGSWKLAFVGLNGNAALRPYWGNYNQVSDVDYIRVRDLPAPFTTDNGIATLHNTSPVSGTPVTGEANGIDDLYFTLNGAPSANDVGARLDYRRQDASNYWSAYIRRNAGNTAWDFLLDSVAAGTPTNRLTATGVGTPDCMRVIHDASNHDCYSKVTTTWTKRGAQGVNAALATQTGVVPTAGTGGSISQLDIWARASGLYNALDQV